MKCDHIDQDVGVDTMAAGKYLYKKRIESAYQNPRLL